MDLQRPTSSGSPCVKPFLNPYPACTPAHPQPPVRDGAQHAQHVSDHQIWRTGAFRKKRKQLGHCLWQSLPLNKLKLRSLPGTSHHLTPQPSCDRSSTACAVVKHAVFSGLAPCYRYSSNGCHMYSLEAHQTSVATLQSVQMFFCSLSMHIHCEQMHKLLYVAQEWYCLAT